MDIRMSGIDGLEPTRRIMAASHPPRVLILTTFDGDEYIIAALVAEASGFLLKDVASEQLPAGIRTITQGDSLLSPSVTRRLIESFIRDYPPTPQTQNVRIRRSHDTNDNAECRIAATVIDIQSDA